MLVLADPLKHWLRKGDVLKTVNGEVVDVTLYKDKLNRLEMLLVEFMFMRTAGLNHRTGAGMNKTPLKKQA